MISPSITRDGLLITRLAIISLEKFQNRSSRLRAETHRCKFRPKDIFGLVRSEPDFRRIKRRNKKERGTIYSRIFNGGKISTEWVFSRTSVLLGRLDKREGKEGRDIAERISSLVLGPIPVSNSFLAIRGRDSEPLRGEKPFLSFSTARTS